MNNDKKENLLKLKLKLLYYKKRYSQENFKYNDSPDKGGYNHRDASLEKVQYYERMKNETQEKIEQVNNKNESKKR